MAANGQAKDLGLVLDESQARFDVVIRRHVGCLERGCDGRMRDEISGVLCWNQNTQAPDSGPQVAPSKIKLDKHSDLTRR